MLGGGSGGGSSGGGDGRRKQGQKINGIIATIPPTYRIFYLYAEHDPKSFIQYLKNFLL